MTKKLLRITFTHPDGRLAGLHARDAVEGDLKRFGCKFLDGGTNFKPEGKPGRYLSTELAVSCQCPIPKATMLRIMENAGIKKFKTKKFKTKSEIL